MKLVLSNLSLFDTGILHIKMFCFLTGNYNDLHACRDNGNDFCQFLFHGYKVALNYPSRLTMGTYIDQK